MSKLREFERSLQLATSKAVGDGLTYLQIQNALTDALARATVASAKSKQELDTATEVVRHTLDERITYYDDYTRHAGTD